MVETIIDHHPLSLPDKLLQTGSPEGGANPPVGSLSQKFLLPRREKLKAGPELAEGMRGLQKTEGEGFDRSS